MTIIVEDGTEVTDANSYINVADTKIFLDALGHTDWGFLDTVTQEASVLRAAAYIESKYKLRWKGFSATSTQVMTFPRIGVVDENGRTLDSDTIPQELIDAQATLINLTVDDLGDLVDLSTSTTSEDNIKKVKEKLDVLETETEFWIQQSQTFYTAVDDLLLPLTKSLNNGTVVRG